MIQLVHEITHLVLQGGDLPVAFRQLLLLALQIERLLIDEPIELLDLVQSLADLKFKVSDVSAQIVPLVCLHLICNVQSVNFFQVFAVSLPEGGELVVGLAFLGLEAGVGVLAHLLLVLDPLDVDVTVADQRALPVELRVKLCVLPFSIVIDLALLIDLRSERLDESNVSIDT